ncbi:MAG: ABC transporter ATP-binding protein [Eubacteriales bacterium]|nr:ABC transporter ATP-binding protein [Eubacteriales bacterium]
MYRGKAFDHFRTEFFSSKKSSVVAIDGVSFSLDKGEIVGLVGESGCGKSVTSLSIMQLLKDTPGKVTNGEVIFEGKDLLKASKKEMLDIRGGRISMIFQEPMSSLNPSMRIDKQLIEGIRLHTDLSKEQARERAAKMLSQVGIPDPPRVMKNYPHQLSGGMSQRVMIAMAMSCDPQLLIVDEPTTALDVTIQAQVLNLLHHLQENFDLTYVFISHDLSVVEMISDRIAVMYLGFVVETAPKELLYKTPMHPYTQALLSAVPIPDPGHQQERIILEGDIPSTINLPKGCPFAARCKMCKPECLEQRPATKEVESGHFVSCHLFK